VSRCRAGIHPALPSRSSSSGSFAKSIAISRASSIVMMPVCPALSGSRHQSEENANLLPGGVLDAESVRHLDDPPRRWKTGIHHRGAAPAPGYTGATRGVTAIDNYINHLVHLHPSLLTRSI
jgi:hypothetical protein